MAAHELIHPNKSVQSHHRYPPLLRQHGPVHGWLSRGTALEVILWTSAHRGKVIPSSTVAAHHTQLVRRAVPSTVSLIRTAKSTRSRATLLERRVLTLIVAMTPGSISMLRELLRVKPLPLRPGLELKCTCSSVCLASMTFALVIIAASKPWPC